MTETWYVCEDNTAVHPNDVSPDKDGVLRHKDGRAVAMRGDVPRSRSVDPDAELEKAKAKEKPETKPPPAATPNRVMAPNEMRKEMGLKPIPEENPTHAAGADENKDLQPAAPRRTYLRRDMKPEETAPIPQSRSTEGGKSDEK